MGRIDLSVFKPNLTAFGYALFLAINAASVWGGVFPFLPPSFQTGRRSCTPSSLRRPSPTG